MLIDARSVQNERTLETDVCIIGAGAAGITLAREFIDQPFRVFLLESGGFEFDAESQSLYAGENVGLPYSLVQSRLRFFGGATNHWVGWCRPLEEIDFETRPRIPHSGWPIRRADLQPFYERAQAICQLGPYEYEPEAWASRDSPLLQFAGDRVVNTVYQFSPPTRFGRAYRAEVLRAGNVATCLHGNAIEIETTETARSATSVRVACLSGNQFRVAARLVLLAAGGIENARLLLLSNGVQREGIGNQKDLVGRFFMDHPHHTSGVVLPSDPALSTALYTGSTATEKVGAHVAIALSARVQREEGLGSFVASLFPPRTWPQVSKGVASLDYLTSSLREGEMPDHFAEHLGAVVADFDDVARASYGRLFGGNKRPPSTLLSLHGRSEHLPNPDSRVSLAEERDSLGQRRVRLDWRLGSADKRTIRRAHEIIAEEMGRAGLGRVKLVVDEDYTLWSQSIRGGSHHMGTTRMHEDPNHGVVDADCRVHGMANLFVAGSSVFPTCGYANPTLTLVALAVRLADHVKKVLS
ncbi:MAG: GMC family oxidoreductase [Myxococcales bacterium]|nr:GMC family oxidoreductase [Myxococcales bacterium]